MVSVCIATYNGSKFILPQLQSIIKQLGANDEIVISDDKSTDNTLEIIHKINDPRIKVFINNLEKGYSRNFENAIMKSKGDVIFLSDQDDVWIDGKVTKMLEKLKSAEMVISDAEIVNEHLEKLHQSHFKLRGVKKGFMINFLKTRYIGACMAFRREILNKAFPFPRNQYLCAHDYWLALVAELYYKIILVEEPLMKYRRHGLNASSGGDTSPFTVRKKIQTRFYTLMMLISRICK